MERSENEDWLCSPAWVHITMPTRRLWYIYDMEYVYTERRAAGTDAVPHKIYKP